MARPCRPASHRRPRIDSSNEAILNGNANPVLIPLRGLLLRRGVRVQLTCHLDRDIQDCIRPGKPIMRELHITAPLLASHRLHEERRIVVGIGDTLEGWRSKLLRRGINLLSVSADGLIANTEGIADKICNHIYRVSCEDLRDMISSGMPLIAISAFTGMAETEISRIVPRFYGKTIREMREDAMDRIQV
jgi:hypothetical protein